MQKDVEVGRIAMAVPVIIARALEMFLKTLLTKTCLVTQSKPSTVMSVAHMKQCIESEKLFHFLKEAAERATSTAAQRDNRGLKPNRVNTPSKRRPTWSKWRREGASPRTSPAPVSRSSTSAYDRERNFNHFIIVHKLCLYLFIYWFWSLSEKK
ncbi:dr1-associated corepressor isoform X2 [Scophthalmus maximus]|nr:dr1-associated corepressor isoform X2 [Scophthalmus maximus]